VDPVIQFGTLLHSQCKCTTAVMMNVKQSKQVGNEQNVIKRTSYACVCWFYYTILNVQCRVYNSPPITYLLSKMNQAFHPLSLTSNLILSSYLRLSISSDLFSGFIQPRPCYNSPRLETQEISQENTISYDVPQTVLPSYKTLTITTYLWSCFYP
jgi:hypothetical protein